MLRSNKSDADRVRLRDNSPAIRKLGTGRWQLIINTGTTIVTFLMVFLIQNTQNRDSEAMHIKLDELIRAIDGAHNALLNLENLGERELDRIRADYIRLAEEARETLLEKSTGASEISEPENRGHSV